MADIITQITSSGLCHGCGACAAAVGNGKVTMSMSDAGYLRPVTTQPLNGADEAVVKAVCGGDKMVQSRSPDVFYDRDWGPIVSLETGYSTDPEIRYRGSSGGVISAVVAYLLETGQVDFVLQTAADLNDPIGNSTRASDNRDEVIIAAGSRYTPSSPLADLELHLQKGKSFAFVGKPCDVASLRRMALRDPRIDQLIPYKLAFFCAGIPSRKGAQKVLEALGVAENEVVEFAYRGRGWPGLARAVRRDGSEESMDYNASWGTILNRHLQFRCKICVEGTGEFSDITCADAWYGKDGYPDFAERDGRSLIVARTLAGRALLDAMKSAGKLASEPLHRDEVARMQPYQYDRKRAVLARTLATRLRFRRSAKYSGFGLLKLSLETLRSRPMWLLRQLLGTFKRIGFSAPID